MKKFFSAEPFGSEAVLLLLRLTIAVFMIIHGKEVFDADKMKEYTSWDSFKGATYLPYIGKGAELIAGILLLPGLFTRVAALLMIGTFGYITFFVGHGKFWMEDQHPFLFVLFGLLFLFAGPGSLSMDKVLFKRKKLY